MDINVVIASGGAAARDRPVAVPLQRLYPVLAHEGDALVGTGSEVDEVAEIEDDVHALLGEDASGGLQGLDVPVDVGDDSGSQAVNSLS